MGLRNTKDFNVAFIVSMRKFPDVNDPFALPWEQALVKMGIKRVCKQNFNIPTLLS